MKILHKTIWMLCLLIGIVSSILYSCTTEYILHTNYLYKNNTQEIVQMSIYDSERNFANYTLMPNSEISIITEGDGGKVGIIPPFVNPNSYRGIANKVVLKFETSQKCLEYGAYPKEHAILDPKKYDNYSSEFKEKSNNTLIFIINQEELDLATPCE